MATQLGDRPLFQPVSNYPNATRSPFANLGEFMIIVAAI